jgi:NADH-quinone oxidoreductase subunit G
MLMTQMVTLIIDGLTVQAPSGTLIVDAAKKAGIDIPVFCYHPKMEPVGMCRMCLVEVGRPVVDRTTGQVVRETDGSVKIQFALKLETACTTPISEGMVVVGLSDKVQAARKDVIEFILTSHPLDCPICDKGGECPLQNLTMEFGSGESRFLYDQKMHLQKHVPLGELIYLDRERCIQCGRCVRFQTEVVDDPVIGFYHRGRSLEIVTYSDPGFDSYFSGNTTDICPVGALTTADFRFGARPWEMQATASICPQCPVGCNIVFNVRREARAGGEVVIKRAMPRQNESVNEIYICDKGRFTYHYAESTDRLSQPLLRQEGELLPAAWEDALDAVAQRFDNAGGGFLSIASGRLTNEDCFSLYQLTTGLGGRAGLYTHMGGGDLVAQVGVGKGTDFASIGKGTAILVVASDLEEEAPVWWLRVKQAAERGAELIVVNPRPTKLDRYAAHTLRYTYGSEAATILGMVNALSAKRPDAEGKIVLSKELKIAAEAFNAAQDAVVLFGSEGLGLEGSSALARACANLLLVTNHAGKPNNGLIGVWQRANDQGAWDMGLRPIFDLPAAIKESRVIYIVAADPAGDDPALRQALVEARGAGAFIVVQELLNTSTVQMADVVLPVLPFTEREGTYTSGERRVQRFYPAVKPKTEARADLAIIEQIGERLGMDIGSPIPARIMLRIVASVPAYAELAPNPYRRLAEVHEQWPVIGRGDIYYGGTTYDNTQGLGIQLASGVERGEVPTLGWPKLPEIPQVGNEQLLGVPVTVLYDRGITVMPATLLEQRIPQPQVVLNPLDAERLRYAVGTAVSVQVEGVESRAVVRLDAGVPVGVALVPRSLGIPLHQPTAITISLSEVL